MTTTLFEHHSLTSCINEGNKFVAKHLKVLFVTLTPYFVVSAAMFIVFITLNIEANIVAATKGIISLEQLLTLLVVYTLFCCMETVTLGREFLLINRVLVAKQPQQGEEHVDNDTSAAEVNNSPSPRTLRQTLRLSLQALPYAGVLFLAFMPGFPIVEPLMGYVNGLETGYKILAMCLLLGLVIVMIVAIAPLVYTLLCGMLGKANVSETSQKESFKKQYLKGWKHKGKIIAICLWGGFLLLLPSFFVFSPCIASMYAYFSDREEVLNFSNTAAIPFYAYIIIFVSSLIAISIFKIMLMAFKASLVYMFADISVRDEKNTEK